MIGLDLRLHGDMAFPELEGLPITDVTFDNLRPPAHLFHLANDAPDIAVAVLDHGTTSGRPSLVMRINLNDGQVVLAETTARLFCTAAKMIMTKYPDLFDGDD